MSKMTIRIIMNSGCEFLIKCEEFTLNQNELGVITGYDIKGTTENEPVYLDFQQVAAIIRTFSDEVQTDKSSKEGKNITFKEVKTKCPFCDGDNENAIIFTDKPNKEYFVYCEKCKIETIDTYKSKAEALKAFSEGKTKSY